MLLRDLNQLRLNQILQSNLPRAEIGTLVRRELELARREDQRRTDEVARDTRICNDSPSPEAGLEFSFDRNGECLAVRGTQVPTVMASRDEKGKLFRLEIFNSHGAPTQTLEKCDGTWKRNGKAIEGQVELRPTGEIIQFVDKERPLYVRRPDGSEILQVEESSDITSPSYRYILSRPYGWITEYHYRKGVAATTDTLEVVKQGQRNIDGSLRTDMVIRRMPPSFSGTDRTSIWTYTDHPDIRSGKSPQGLTWRGTIEFDPANGRQTRVGCVQGKDKIAKESITGDGWRRGGDEPFFTKVDVSGTRIQKSLSGQIENVFDRQGNTFAIQYKNGKPCELTITGQAGVAGNEQLRERLYSENGTSWIRDYYDPKIGRWQKESFTGEVTTSSTGAILISRQDGKHCLFNVDGTRVFTDKLANKLTIIQTDKQHIDVLLDQQGHPIKIARVGGRYAATDDGINWFDYTEAGTKIDSSQRKQIVRIERSSGSLQYQKADGSITVEGADGSRQILQMQNGRLVITDAVTIQGERIGIKYKDGNLEQTEITSADKSVLRYDGDNRLIYMKDVKGSVISIEWDKSSSPASVASYTDESGKWSKKGHGARVFFENEHRIKRFEQVYVNGEGRFERIYEHAPVVIGLPSQSLRELRGIDGNLVVILNDGGIAIRNKDGYLLRSVSPSGTVRQFSWGKDDKFQQHQLEKMIVGEGEEQIEWKKEPKTESSGTEAVGTLPTWRCTGGPLHGKSIPGSFRVDPVTAAMLFSNVNFEKERFVLSSSTWVSFDNGAALRARADQLKKDTEWSRIFYPPWCNSRATELATKLEGFSGDEVLVLKSYLKDTRDIDISKYVADWYSPGSEMETFQFEAQSGSALPPTQGVSQLDD